MHASSSYNIDSLVLVCPPRLARPRLRRTTSLALHLSRREATAIAGRLSCVALSMALLAAEAELCVLLLALAAARSSFAAVGLGVVGLEANVKEVLLISLCDVRALAFCE